MGGSCVSPRCCPCAAPCRPFDGGVASVPLPALCRGVLRPCARCFAKPPSDPAKWSGDGEDVQRKERALPPTVRRGIWSLPRREPGGRKRCGIKRWLHRLSHRPAMRAGDTVFKQRPPLFRMFSKYSVAPLLRRSLLFRLQFSRNPPLFRRFGWLRCGSFALKSRFLEV